MVPLSPEDTQQIAYVMIDSTTSAPVRRSHRATRPSPLVRLRRLARQILELVPPAWHLAGRVWSWMWPPVVGVLVGTGVAVAGAIITFLCLLEFGS